MRNPWLSRVRDLRHGVTGERSNFRRLKFENDPVFGTSGGLELVGDAVLGPVALDPALSRVIQLS